MGNTITRELRAPSRRSTGVLRGQAGRRSPGASSQVLCIGFDPSELSATAKQTLGQALSGGQLRYVSRYFSGSHRVAGALGPHGAVALIVQVGHEGIIPPRQSLHAHTKVWKRHHDGCLERVR